MGKQPHGTPSSSMVIQILQFITDFWLILLLLVLGLGCLCLFVLRLLGYL